MTSDAFLLTRPGHTPTVKGVGWGEPATIYVRCTCGWQGITICEPHFKPGETEFNGFIEPFRTLVRTYGPDIVLGDNDAYGTYNDAYRQALAHVGYDPADDHQTVTQALTDATTMLQDTLAAPGMTLNQIQQVGRVVSKSLTDLNAAAKRLHIWNEAPLPVLPDRDPEGLRLVAEAHAARHASTKKG